MVAKPVVLALVLALAASINAQPFNVARFRGDPNVTVPLSEPNMRAAINYEGFVFDFKAATPLPNELAPNGNITTNQVMTNPFLSTLPGDGNGQTLVTFGACGGNTPHSHPRGSEISTLLYGNITFGMVEENPRNNELIERRLLQGNTIHVPSGVMHFSFNDNCEPAAFLANFAHADPGTQTTWHSLMHVPTRVLHAATGIPEAQIAQLKAYPLVISPGTGGEECLRRCGMPFLESNGFLPVSTVA